MIEPSSEKWLNGAAKYLQELQEDMDMKKLYVLVISAFILILPALSSAATLGLSRISFMEGDVQVRTEEAAEWMPASINTPLKEGDSIWCPDGGRAELQMRDGTVLRLDERSSLDILALDEELMQFHLGMGHLYAKTGKLKEETLQVDLPDSTLLVDGKARLRVDITDKGDEEISIFKGSVYVESGAGKTRVRTGEMLTNGDRGSADISPLDPPDAWEKWNTQRDRKLADKRRSSRYLPEELASYAADFDTNGEWVVIRDYGYVWRPTVIYSDDWSPYRVGRWTWVGGDYVWISYENWGWAPYHYGRWINVPARGWCWVPPARNEVYWAPGYVGWVSTSTYVGWVPLAPGETYYGRGYYGRNSVNITTVNVRTTVVNNVYRNVSVNNAVTVVKRDSFVSGRPAYVKPRENVFVRGQMTVGRPDIQPRREAYMPLVKPIAPAKLPPPALRRPPIRQLQERHPLLAERGAVKGQPQSQRSPINSGVQVRGAIVDNSKGNGDGAKVEGRPVPRRGEQPETTSRPRIEERGMDRHDRQQAGQPQPQRTAGADTDKALQQRGGVKQPEAAGAVQKQVQRGPNARVVPPGNKKVWKIRQKEMPAKKKEKVEEKK